MSPTTDPPEPPGSLEPPAPPTPTDFLPRDVAEAVLQLFLCDSEIESRSRELEVAQALLATAASSPELVPVVTEVDTAIGCLLDHLRPAREVVRSVEPLCSSWTCTSGLRVAARKQTLLRAVDHLLYQDFFAGIDEEAVAALRHRELCPVCARMTRILLFGFAPPPGSPPAGRGAPAGGPGKASEEKA